MNFDDKELESLNLRDVNDFIKLFIKYLCGEKPSKEEINEQDKSILEDICTQQEFNLDYEQLNTILLILNQPTISEEFFQFFFDEFSVKLKNVKMKELPNSLQYQIKYNDKKEVLICKGVMSKTEKNALLRLSSDNEYKRAVDELFKSSQDKRVRGLRQLQRGVAKFRVYAMLQYGNFRFAYKELSAAEPKMFKRITEPFTCERGNEIKASMSKRPDKLVKTEDILKHDTYHLGYLSAAQVTKDLVTYAAIHSIIKKVSVEDAYNKVIKKEKNKGKIISNINKIKQEIEEDKATLEEVKSLVLAEAYDKISETNKKIKALQKKGQKNTDTYLTWDYMDVYVATSMREEWEYKACSDFIKTVFKNDNDKKLKQLKLRYFDPTQSYVPNRIDKGLIEGLMLKRATCTIYLAQETDTLGKDSELAATLAQGKPVIAFVPEITDKKKQAYIKKYKSYGLRFLAKRLMLLEADEILEEPELQRTLESKFGLDYRNELDKLREKVNEYVELRLFYSWESSRQKKYRDTNETEFNKLWNVFVEIEKFYFDKRADTLVKKHPLAIQVNVNTGTANGVLVVRNEGSCAKLLHRIFTNTLDFEIAYEPEEKVTLLKEKTSLSPYRVVTDYEKLTNSFWNFYLTEL